MGDGSVMSCYTGTDRDEQCRKTSKANTRSSRKVFIGRPRSIFNILVCVLATQQWKRSPTDGITVASTEKHFYEIIVENEIIKIIAKFDQNKSPGLDGIGNFVLKRIAKEIVKPLTTIFNTSISSGKVPDSLKIAKVVPIYKKDDAQVFSDYRPVSVLPSFSKILERLVFNRCVSFIDKQNIINGNQYGFRSGHSTYMAMIDLVDKICNAVENNKQAGGLVFS